MTDRGADLTDKFIAYYRVSTASQGRSGLGLEAQRYSVTRYLSQQNGAGARELLAEFTEQESGRDKNRPLLLAAIVLARKTGARLVVAKLDRLARNAAFLLTLRDSGVRFVAVDMPEADEFTVGIMALVAEQEVGMIRERTKAALKAAKARGTVLGNPRLSEFRKAAAESTISKADDFAKATISTIKEIERAGLKTLRGIAGALNARGIKTARGGAWGPQTVANLVRRAA